MYKIFFNKVKKTYELMELVRMFLPPSAYHILNNDPWDELNLGPGDIPIRIPDNIEDKNEGKQFLYRTLAEYTGKKPDWGTLTGVRPVKLTTDLISRFHSPYKVMELLIHDYYLSEEKARLLTDIWEVQKKVLKERKDSNAVGIYIGIPFCPTRCIYCSFPSYQVTDDLIINDYLSALCREIEFTGYHMKQRGWYPESIYIGGGTPTALTEKNLEVLLKSVNKNFDLTDLKEFTVEAGRPDTINPEKLKIIKNYKAGRISINPQSMKEETLKRIGRSHKPQDIERAFEMAKQTGFDVINADLIAGLPGENTEDFIDSMKRIIGLGPENITIHTLAVKRASKLKELDGDYNYHQGKKVREMLDFGADILNKAGYRPYYLYRLKQMAGNFENIGYALPGTENIYNIKIMDESQTILAMGAGGISKVWYPSEKRLERVPNVSNYELYIERIDEMLQRKLDGIFRQDKQQRRI